MEIINILKLGGIKLEDKQFLWVSKIAGHHTYSAVYLNGNKCVVNLTNSRYLWKQ